ncbi:hypothetical protein DFH09DRAFT_1107990 [Mycena vulgaris]|nr:hypothetical protein DFH09DRAFT_1107990 [Mycena vulgaris]
MAVANGDKRQQAVAKRETPLSFAGLNDAAADALVLWAMLRGRLRCRRHGAMGRLWRQRWPDAEFDAITASLMRHQQPPGTHQRRGRSLGRVWQLPGSGGTDTQTQRLLLVAYYIRWRKLAGEEVLTENEPNKVCLLTEPREELNPIYPTSHSWFRLHWKTIQLCASMFWDWK